MPRPSYPDLRELLIDAYRGVGGRASEYIYTISGFVQQAGYTDYFDYSKEIYDPALRKGVNRLDRSTIDELEELYRNKASMVVITVNYDGEDNLKEVGLGEYRFVSDGMVAAMWDIDSEPFRLHKYTFNEFDSAKRQASTFDDFLKLVYVNCREEWDKGSGRQQECSSRKDYTLIIYDYIPIPKAINFPNGLPFAEEIRKALEEQKL